MSGKIIKRPILSLFALMAFMTPMIMGGTSYVVIVNKSSSISKLSRHELAQVFLKKVSKVNGADVQPVDLAPSSSMRVEFSKVVMEKSVSAVNSYWQQQIFSGKGVPPSEMAEDDAVAFVRSNASGIAYVSPQKAVGGVKVIEVLE